ncbi:hypothetical protein Cru_0030 [Candidatus Carsonella ruddii DC]
MGFLVKFIKKLKKPFFFIEKKIIIIKDIIEKLKVIFISEVGKKLIELNDIFLNKFIGNRSIKLEINKLKKKNTEKEKILFLIVLLIVFFIVFLK